MPEMNGKEAVTKIRQYEQENDLKACPIIFITGNCSASEVEECMDPSKGIRANAFLRKPVSRDTL